MAEVRSPNRDFTLNTPGNRIQMTGNIGTAPAGIIVLPSGTPGLIVPTPAATALASTGGPQSYPLGG